MSCDAEPEAKVVGDTVIAVFLNLVLLREVGVMSLHAKIFRYCDLSLQDLKRLKIGLKKALIPFELDGFSARSLCVAKASRPNGDCVGLIPIETTLMVTSACHRPDATTEEKQAIGDVIDTQIVQAAQESGIQKLLLVVPYDQPISEDETTYEVQNVRLYVRRIPQTTPAVGLALPNTSSPSKYLN
jgi:hypothetical protein